LSILNETTTARRGISTPRRTLTPTLRLTLLLYVLTERENVVCLVD